MADPQSLPFAPHVENRALERLLQRGLLYNDGQAQAARVRYLSVFVVDASYIYIF